VNVLLVSAHDWFASALKAVLEPEGYVFHRVRDARTAVRDAEHASPELVIVGEGLPDMDPSLLTSALRSGPLRESVPILVYSPNFWHEAEQAQAMAAGAWDIIKEPVRPRLILAKLQRLLEIKRLIELTEEESLTDAATGLYNLAGLLRAARLLESAALRNGVSLACVVLGPGREEPGESERQRRAASELFRGQLRGSDACGWVGETELGVVAYNTDAVGVTAMVRRLNRVLEGRFREDGLDALSAGVVEMTPGAGVADAERARAPANRIASLSRFAAAQTALRQAREAGGGIRIADLP
jgi:CheY-like chemotaxis protein